MVFKKPGDLVTEINGIQLNSLATGMNLFQTLGDATLLALSIERNGAPVQLSLDLSQIDLNFQNPNRDHAVGIFL